MLSRSVSFSLVDRFDLCIVLCANRQFGGSHLERICFMLFQDKIREVFVLEVFLDVGAKFCEDRSSFEYRGCDVLCFRLFGGVQSEMLILLTLENGPPEYFSPCVIILG